MSHESTIKESAPDSINVPQGFKGSPSPWEYIPSNENHGAYVTNRYGGDVCDCYVMSNPNSLAVCNGGDSKPIPFSDADDNARLIAATPDLLAVCEYVASIFDDAKYPHSVESRCRDKARVAIARATGATP